MLKVLLVIAYRDFQPLEYGAPKKVLENGGVEIITASNKLGAAISSNNAQEAKVNLLVKDTKAEDYDGVFFIGGPGALENLDNEDSYKLIKDAQTKCKVFGAICISPRILAVTGVLKGKKATGWDGDDELESILKKAGAQYVREPVVTDGNLITASGPVAAEEFGRVILDKLK
ncbi:MAG: DJ-1/PfpI family protein [Candidatus Magasanikbacteria bacterium]